MTVASPFTVGCLQTNTGNDMQANLATMQALGRQARDQGADMLFMPENVSMMEWGRPNIIGKARPEADHPALACLRDMARDLGVWVHGGSLTVLLPDERVANRTYVLTPDGDIAATYDKIHMFDVDLGHGESYRESATFEPGDKAVVVDLPWGRLGLSICYDLRFPHLFRALAKAGADFLTIPAAFTRTTGMAHWHVLQRARAIETGCWVISPAQCGTHVNNRQTYGHTLVVDPWGQVVADGGEDPGLIVATIDPAQVADARGKVPSLSHDRAFDLP